MWKPNTNFNCVGAIWANNCRERLHVYKLLNLSIEKCLHFVEWANYLSPCITLEIDEHNSVNDKLRLRSRGLFMDRLSKCFWSRHRNRINLPHLGAASALPVTVRVASEIFSNRIRVHGRTTCEELSVR